MNVISFKQNTSTELKQSQNLLLSMAMQQAFHVLQMPTLELAEWLKQQIEDNPVLELDLSESEGMQEQYAIENEDPLYDENADPAILELEKKRRSYQESLLVYPTSLYEHLVAQARLAFEDPIDLAIAEQIIGHLDSKGFLTAPLSEMTSDIKRAQDILSVLQTFDPSGICAHHLQESLLIQLKLLGKTQTLAYQIIEHYFSQLLLNQIPLIAKHLKTEPRTVQETIHDDIAVLNLNPGSAFDSSCTAPIFPDIHLDCIDGKWEIKIHQNHFPQFQISPVYQTLFIDPSLSKEEKKFFHKHIESGNWLKKIVKRREDTLIAITEHLIKKQSLFLAGEQKTLVPMKMQEIAEEIGMHESTIARAISNKYLSCPQGIFSLRSFFTQGLLCQNGQKVSNHTLSQLLAQFVEQEDKAHPLSDEEIAAKFKKMGIPCARRTVTKYRQKLHIASAAKRRQWL